MSDDSNVIRLRELTAQAPEWQATCIRSDKGVLLPIQANAVIALDALLPGQLAFDEMLQAPVLLGGDGPRRAVRDCDISTLRDQLQHIGFPRMGWDTVHRAIEVISDRTRVHPVREYLAGLSWDGVARLPSFFPSYFGAADGRYEREVGRMFVISMVARIAQPGSKVDHVPVIEGPQGALKSSACAVLGGDYFSDELPDIDSKDASVHLRGKWLIEVAEMHAMSRAETTRLKSFITRQVERFRPPYGRLEVLEPRQCVFVGTTNADTYLKDPTGGRRFWPIRAGVINVEHLQRDRDQLFAEAIARHKCGERWWPSKAFEREHIMPEQAARYDADAWEDSIRSYLAGKDKATVGQVAADALNISIERLGTADQRRIAAAMEQIGWRRGDRDGHGRWWVRRL
jgi:predicted P-loop ATPase